MGASVVLLLILMGTPQSDAVRALEKSRDAFVESVTGLTAAQLNWKIRPEVDSILEMARYVAENEAKPERPLETLSAILDHFETARARSIARARKGEDTAMLVKETEKWTKRIRTIQSLPLYPKGPRGG